MSTDKPFFLAPYFEPLEGPQSEGAQALFAYWRGLAEAPALPRRGQIEMQALTELGCVDSIFILEPSEDGDDWRYRLLGTRIVSIYGAEVTNVPFRQHMTPDEAEAAIRLSNQVRDSREPLFLKARFVSGDHMVPIETMSLPILGRGDEVWLFGATFFKPR